MTPRSDVFPALRKAAFIAAAVALSLPTPVTAAEKDMTFELRPHCTSNELAGFGGSVPDVEGITTPVENKCYVFETRDPMTKQTRMLREGDTLDMDLVLKNPSEQDVTRFRAWLSYDPTILEGVSIELDDDFPTPTPGETDFAPDDGLAKIAASADDPEDDDTMVLARIKFRVINAGKGDTIVSFYDSEGGDAAHTLVMAGEPEDNALLTPLGALRVRVNASDAPAAQSSSSETAQQIPSSSSIAPVPASSLPIASSSTSSVPAVPPSSLFPQLQVQNVRVTTEGSSIYLAWDALTSTELNGYNVYYGTVSGQYIQRRSVDKGSTTLTLRNLTPGKTYYLAVRGVSTRNVESEFSQEVGVTVGNPASSTSPLAHVANQGPNGIPPKTGGNVAGGTGLPSPLVLLIISSAVIGTAFAFRRQLTAQSPRA